jgi:hypothetical protein
VGAGGTEDGEGEEEGEVRSLTIQQQMRELASAMVVDWKEERGGLGLLSSSSRGTKKGWKHR